MSVVIRIIRSYRICKIGNWDFCMIPEHTKWVSSDIKDYVYPLRSFSITLWTKCRVHTWCVENHWSVTWSQRRQVRATIAKDYKHPLCTVSNTGSELWNLLIQEYPEAPHMNLEKSNSLPMLGGSNIVMFLKSIYSKFSQRRHFCDNHV